MSDNRFKIARDWSKLEIKNQGQGIFIEAKILQSLILIKI